MHRAIATLVALACASVPFAAIAGSYQVRYGGDNVAAILVPEHDVQINAFGRVMQTVNPLVGETTTRAVDVAKFRNAIRRRLDASTVARAEYQPPSGGATVTIHSASGPSIRTAMDSGLRSIKSDTGSSSDPSSPEGMAQNIERDAEESSYFPKESTTEFRAKNIATAPGGKVTVLDDFSKHYADAELKIARELETRFLDERLQPGGKLVVYVSQEVCGSCSANLDVLATEYDVDVEVYQLSSLKTISSIEQQEAARIAGRDLFGTRQAMTVYMFDEVQRGELEPGTWSASTRRAVRLGQDLDNYRICPIW